MLLRLIPECFISLAATTEPHGCDRHVLNEFGEVIGKKVKQVASHFSPNVHHCFIMVYISLPSENFF